MGTYRLPLISGVLLAVVFFPFYVWPLVLVALLPLFYFAASPERSRGEVFFGGAIVGAIGIGPLIYFSLAFLRIIPDALLFSYMIRLSSIPAFLLVVTLFGLLAVLYRELRSHNLLLAAGVGAALYTIIEIILFPVFGGYYLGSLAHAAVSLFPLLSYAALGGALFVSFLIAGVSAFIAEAYRSWSEGRRKDTIVAVLSVACLLVGLYGSHKIFFRPAPSTEMLSVSIIQTPYIYSAEELSFGVYENGRFSNSELERYLEEAAKESELIIYPFSPSKGAVYKGERTEAPGTIVEIPAEALGLWLSDFMPKDTATLFWHSEVERGNLYDQYTVWKNKEEYQYRKQALYAFSDYEPAWSHIFGLPRRPKTTTPGGGGEMLLGERSMTGLICSELHQVGLAGERASAADVIIAVGSDAMFPGELAGNFSLAAARLRAAENSVPVVRGNINGPSALIRPDGSVEAQLPYQSEGILRGSLPVSEVSTTPYAQTGPLPLYLLIGALIAGALGVRRKIKFLQIREQDSQ